MSQLARGRENLRPLWIFLSVYTLLFFGLAYRKYALFTNDSADTAIFVHAYWATLEGKFFWHYFLDMCYFGDHGGFILIALVPLYALFPAAPTLLFLQSAFIAASGVPMYLIARRVLKKQTAALCLTAAFLFFPTIVSQHVNQIHDTQFVLVFLVGAFYFYHIERFGLFVLFLILSCLGKENVPLTLLVFGVYAAIQRRHWKWIVAPIGISVTALVVLFKVVMPFFRGGQPYRSFSYFGPLGDTPLQVFKTSITKPDQFAAALVNQQNIMFLIQLVQPVGWILPFLALPVIFVLPDLGTNLLCENASLKIIRWHYNVTVGAFLFIAAAFSVRKLSVRFAPSLNETGLAVLLLCLSIAHWTLWFDPNDYRRPPQAEALAEALAIASPDASILVPQTALAHVAKRWHFSTIHHWLIHKHKPERIFTYKYVVMDLNEQRPQWAVPQEVVKAYASNPNYELVFNKQNVVVFRLRGDDPWRGQSS